MVEMKKELSELKKKDLYREFRTITGPNSSQVKLHNRNCIMLASNNYFNLNTHPKVKQAAKKAIEQYGTGNGSSRLIVNLNLHQTLEKEIAKYKKTKASLVYSSGYAANIGIISAVTDKNWIILSDELNHASIIDGCRLSKAKTIVYKHNDVDDLEKKLKTIKNKRILVVTDSLFSMDGDVAPIKEIIKLKRQYDFMFMVDDAHATGIINTKAKGIDIYMGTLSKALASQGGYVTGSKDLVDYLRNKSRAFIYSTGLSPSDTASALQALKIIQTSISLKKKLLANASYLKNELNKTGFKVSGDYQILTIPTKDNQKTMQFQKQLEKHGIFVTGIRAPTVPTPRLRITVSSAHTKAQLQKAVKAFQKVGNDLDLIHHARTE